MLLVRLVVGCIGFAFYVIRRNAVGHNWSVGAIYMKGMAIRARLGGATTTPGYCPATSPATTATTTPGSTEVTSARG